MGYKLIITKPAEQDLNDIVSYMVNDLSAPKAASDFLDAVSDCYGYLRQTPGMYALCSNPSLNARHYRKAVIKNYILVYRFDETEQTVFILRFFYGGRDYEKLL